MIYSRVNDMRNWQTHVKLVNELNDSGLVACKILRSRWHLLQCSQCVLHEKAVQKDQLFIKSSTRCETLGDNTGKSTPPKPKLAWTWGILQARDQVSVDVNFCRIQSSRIAWVTSMWQTICTSNLVLKSNCIPKLLYAKCGNDNSIWLEKDAKHIKSSR